MLNIDYLFPNLASRKTLFFLLFLLPLFSFAQNGTHITWNFQVACIDFSSETPEKPREDNSIVWEEISNGPCIRVCENKLVTYTVHGNNIQNVQWSVNGGILNPLGPQPSLNASIKWGIAGSGAINITITYTNGTQETATLCIEKIKGPKPAIAIAAGGSTEICLNSPVYFDNLTNANGGTNVIHYLWDFGDGTTSTLFEPNHSYAVAGSYEVTLTATNECNCSNTTSITIDVLNSNPVVISCASVVCEGALATYSVNDTCKGEWNVIGGTIVTNSGNQIEVKWDNVDPDDGFGYVMYRSECGCPAWTTVKVPVVLANGKIQGEQNICTNKQYTFSLPQWPTTAVQWTASDPNVVLTYTPNRNEVVVSTNNSGTFILTGRYLNTLLGCKGGASITITADAPVAINNIDTGNEICAGSSQTFTATPNIPVIWSVAGNGVTDNSAPTNQPFPYTFNTAGTYTVTAIRPGGCAGIPKIVKVIATPAIPAGTISGPDKVCAGLPYTYTLSTMDNNVIPVWEVTNGTVQGNNTGQNVTVIFNPGFTNYTVSVRNKTLDQIGCLSPPKDFTVQAINLNSITVNPNPGPFCPSSTQTFVANLGGITPDALEWSFQNPNFGSFVSGQGTNQINILFNEISNNQAQTNLLLKITKCGTIRTISIPVTLKTLPIIQFANTNNICLGGNLQFTVNVSNLNVSPGQTANVVFTFANGLPPYTAGTVSSNGTYTFSVPNGYISNNTGANITQTVVASLTGNAVCNYQPLVSANFIVYPETKLVITPTFNLEICDPNNYTPYTMYANASSGLTATSQYQWYGPNGLIAGATTNNYTISGSNPFGTYYAMASDVNGCWVKSQVIKVTQKCPTNNCTISPNPDLQIVNYSFTGCNSIEASATFNGTPSQIRWLLNGVLAQSGGTTATLTTTVVGVNVITVEALYGTCWTNESVQLIKNYEPKLNFTQVCNANGTYNLTAHNTSTVFGNVPITYTYVLNSSGLPAQSGQSATFNNLAPGTYSVTLTLTSPGLPTCTITQQIILKPLPTGGFTHTPGLQFCAGEVLDLFITGYDPANTYTFNFAGTSVFATGQQTSITINEAGGFPISLTATSPQGCSFTTPPFYWNINISKPNYAGSLLPTTINVCEGSTIPTIAFTPSVGNPVNYTWMNGNTPVLNSPNSPNFTPTESGNYWPLLKDINGCGHDIMAIQAVPVTIRKKPYVNIVGKANLCAGNSTTLYGVVTEQGMSYTWQLNGTTLASGTGSPTPLNTGNLGVGTYTYSLVVAPQSDPTCGATKNFIITVSSPPSAPVISMSIQCADVSVIPNTPYVVNLSANGPANGQYNWSNGMTGQNIQVSHGGIYSVTYTAPSGCKVESQITVPPNLESLMWIFPTGCYDICPREGYIVGPRGEYDYHEWQLFGNAQQSGNGFIYPYWPGQAGNYQLMINDGTCSYTSGTMTLNPDPDKCGFEYYCKIKAHIEYVKQGDGPYLVFGVIHNFGSNSVTLNLTSGNNSGVYFPSTITIAPGGMYDFTQNPLLFYPAQGFTGGNDTLQITGINCIEKVEVDFPGIASKGSLYVSNIKGKINIVPNPAKSEVTVNYNTNNRDHKASMIMVYDASGNVKYRKNLNSSEGKVSFDTSPWLQGVYIVTVVTPNQPLQAKLLKK